MNIDSFTKGVDKKQIEVREGMTKAIHALAEFCIHEAMANLDRNKSVITGKLKNSMKASYDGEGTFEVKAHVGPNAETPEGVQYGKFVEFGRGPVFVTNKSALHFTIDGQDVFVKSVKAAPAKPFLSPALLSTEKSAPGILRESLGI